jgi:hypothetical protein
VLIPPQSAFLHYDWTTSPHRSPKLEATTTVTMPSRKEQESGEDSYGSVFSVSGPVIVAENMLGCAMYELVGLLLWLVACRLILNRSESDTINSSAKSLG